MSSKILYDTRTLEILWSQSKPYGLGLPSFDSLCRSARVPDDEKQYMDTVIINDDVLTFEAKRKLKIVHLADEKNPSIIATKSTNKKQSQKVQAVYKSKEEIDVLLQKENNEKDFRIKQQQLKDELISALLEEDEDRIKMIKDKYNRLTKIQE